MKFLKRLLKAQNPIKLIQVGLSEKPRVFLNRGIKQLDVLAV